MTRLQKLVMLLGDVNALKGLLLWPKFSFTAFSIVSHLRFQGIVPGTVIDVGANVGQFTVASGKLWPKTSIYSFEPLPASFSRLRENIAKMLNVQAYSLAIGEIEKEVELHINTHSHSSSILPLGEAHLRSFPYAQEVGLTTVQMKTLDGMMADEALASPVLLKIDVQGYEAKVLEGAETTLKRVDYIVIESSFRPMYQDEVCFTKLLELMEGFNFNFLRPLDVLADPTTGEILQADLLFSRQHKG